MNNDKFVSIGAMLAVMAFGASNVRAANAKPAAEAPLTEAGQKLLGKYSEQLKTLQAEIAKDLPKIDEQQKTVFQKTREAVKAAEAEANKAQQPQNSIQTANALVDHAKGKWIGDAEKNIAKAEAALKKAATEAEREAARKERAKWQANKEDGIKALNERQQALDKAKSDGASAGQSNQAAQAALAKARADEQSAAKAFLSQVEPFLSSDKLDAKLVKATVLAEAIPNGLSAFAQQGRKQEALVEKLLADSKLMNEMIEAGGAVSGKYGRAMEIYTAIQKCSPMAGEGVLQRLALATSLEHAVPVKQSNAEDEKNAPDTVDPVQRYQHYEKAYLAGELDPAFKDFTAWEYRMVVDCDAPDQILAWGREMLRTYRPDHVSNSDYGWRYSAAVRTEVRYGSECVKDDLPSLNTYQNIPKDGGVCGRRAFFGRFILRSFGIPVWGVTQHKHAALSHWTPKGWVINLGGGFHASWWDKGDAPRSGTDFLLETQARENAQSYLMVLRAQWVSRVLGEQAYNDRKKIEGGFWSSTAHYQAVALAAHAVELGPLGQELAEANEPREKQTVEQAPVKASDQQVAASREGSITILAVAHSKTTGLGAAMKSYSGGMQMHCKGGFSAQYAFVAPKAGKYALTARVATLQEGQKFLFAANDAKQPFELAVPYTIGLWRLTKPVEISLIKGQNVLNFTVQYGSRDVTFKDITLTALK